MAQMTSIRSNHDSASLSRRLGGGLLALAACGAVQSHELQQNRATLVQRETTFVAMSLYIAMPDALHRAVAPRQPFAEFAVAHVNLPAEAFKSVMLRAQSRLQSETMATADKGQPITFHRWVWPEPARLQAALRARLMESVVAAGDHPHTPPLEVRVELHAPAPMRSLRLQFPPALGRVMVVSYRPRQVWAEPQKLSPEITF